MRETAPRLSVVGIGASAGGLAPLRTFLSALPPDTGMTFVVVTHLSPQHESILAELLQPHTPMPVQQVTERVQMQPNHVYVIPPAKRLVVLEGHLDLTNFDMPRGQRLQIDTFFRSLAEHHGDGGAVILSGSGSDGAVGIQHIKERGGLLLVQDPAEAEYDGMPKSAIATGLVDIVAPVAELAAQLVAAKRTGAALELPTDPAQLSPAAEETLLQLLTHLRVRTGHDFSGYKRATVLRRIGRRMQVAQLFSLTAYLHRLRQDGEEVRALYRDLLIHVTEFFRDPDAWEVLAQTVIPQLFAGKGRDESVRVWTVGCATGEEAYSVAMLLLEYAGTLPHPPQIQVFASDLGELALDFARRGIYPEAIAANISAAQLERFFVQENSHYRVRDLLRERVLFTGHNLLQDPPFSKLDLVLCRNLLIYLQRPLQERVFETFHYALRPNGYLFLGSAESPESITMLFETVDKQYRIYRRSQQSQNTLVLPSLPLQPGRLPSPAQAERTGGEPAPKEGMAQPWLMETVAPPSLVVDTNYQVLQLSETAGRYLHHPAGALTADVLRLVRAELQADLRTALFRALETGKATLTNPVPVRFNGAPHPVALLVRPVRLNAERAQALIFFLEDETPVNAAMASGEGEAQTASVQQMQAELGQAQQQLQALREEYETTVEELRSANEELQSTNEEYRSTMEELETSKEELQSINEELQTVNLELRSKVEETAQANSDLHNLFAATEIATLFLDRELKIKRYTPRAADLFNLMPPDLGRPILHLRTSLHYTQLEEDTRLVLRNLVPIERELQDAEGHWYQVNVRPYRTPDDRIDGIVVTFVDITGSKRAEAALRESQERLQLALAAANMGTFIWYPEEDRGEPDARMLALFGQPADGTLTLAKALAKLIHPDDRAGYAEAVTRASDPASDGALRTDIRVLHPDGEVRWLAITAQVFFAGKLRQAVRMVGAAIDITERKQLEAALRANEEQQAFLLQLSDMLRPLTDPVAVQAEACRLLGEYLGVDRAYYVEVDEAKEEARVHQNYLRGDSPSLVGAFPLAEVGWTVPYLRRGETVVVADTQTAEIVPDADRGWMADLQMHAHISMPIIKQGELMGALCVTELAPRIWTEMDVELTRETAERIWATLVRASAEEALRESEERYRLLVESAQEYAIFMLDGAGHITSWNTGAERVFGYSEEEALGLDEAILFTEKDRAAGVPADEMTTATREGQASDDRWQRRKDGSHFWASGVVEALRHPDGELRGYVKVLRDNTQQKQAEEALQQFNARLEQQVAERTQQVRVLVSQLAMSEQEERQRISQVLHDDLQQRLYAIRFQLNILHDALGGHLESTVEEEAQHLFAQLEEQLAAVIGQTRTLSIDLSPPVLEGEGLDTALGWLATQMQQQYGLSIQVQSTEDLPAMSANLRVLLFQIVRELLFNVVKHAGVAEATVVLRHADEEFRIEVIDQGMGFDATAILENPKQSHGLRQNQQRIELIGGQMQIESNPEGGTHVTLTCPLPVEDRAARA